MVLIKEILMVLSRNQAHHNDMNTLIRIGLGAVGVFLHRMDNILKS